MEYQLDRVNLVNPVPWANTQGSCGFVVAITTESLILETTEKACQMLDDQNTIYSMALGRNQVFKFKGKIAGNAEGFELAISDAEGLDNLRDFLGQIRKNQHIDFCQTEDVEASDRFTGFSRINFVPDALPDIDFNELDTSVDFLGRTFSHPILITGMTGGITKGIEINRRLAQTAAKFNIPMGIGSQRIAIDNPDYAPIFDVKKHAPDLFLIGNIGCAQLHKSNAIDMCKKSIDMVEADALAIHLNILQESIQVEGDRHFKGLLNQIEKLCHSVDTPIIIKEVGCGIDPNTIGKLVGTGVAAVDIGGRGGTSWGYIEGLRSSSPYTKIIADTFRNWGIPTAYALSAARHSFPNLPLIATGGIRDGLTVSKAVALGAKFAGIGLPLLRAALESEEEPSKILKTYIRGLQITLIATGSRTLGDLSQRICLGLPLEKSFESNISSISY